MIQYPVPPLGAQANRAQANRAQANRAQARSHPSAGFWRSLPLALALSAGWWAVGLAAVTALSHWH